MSTRIITASAGSGKTHRLVELVTDKLLDPESGVQPEGLVAVTYTRKAADELRGRLRSRLVRAGRTDLATRLRDARLGTLHAVCAGLIQQFGLELGAPASFATLPELEARRLAREVLEEVLVQRDPLLDAVAERLSQEDWRASIGRVVSLARVNSLDADAIRSAAETSIDSYRTLFSGAASGHWERLAVALERILPTLQDKATASKAAAARLDAATKLQSRLARLGWVTWAEQTSLGKLLKPKSLRQQHEAELEVLENHTRAGELLEDAERFITFVMHTAAQALDAFHDRKRMAKLVDFDDMLALGADLLSHPRVASALSDQLDLVVVDEFQDVSPLQLVVVGKLIDLSGNGAWVGDAKQAIYSFQGADPKLVRAELARVRQAPETLGKSYRSRPPLVRFCSDLFVAAMESHGFPEAQVRLQPARDQDPLLSDVAPVERWTWEVARRVTDTGAERTSESWAVASGIQEHLNEARPVVPKGEEARPVRPGDIAVLCRSNAGVQSVASALRTLGLPVVIRSYGLLDTEEARILRSAMALVLDPGDGAAATCLAWLRDWIDDPDAWLAEEVRQHAGWRVRKEAAELANRPSPRRPKPLDAVPGIQNLRARRGVLSKLSPGQLVPRLAELLDLRAWCLTRPDAATRLGNIDAVATLSLDYESTCRARHEPPALAGFAASLRRVEDLDTGGRQASAGQVDAVTVTTYHASKGLEWPVVVLSQLDARPRASVFGIHVESLEEPDAAAPLRGRSIRLWPWPYGSQSTGIVLDDRAASREESTRVHRDELRERTRLLYVGFTRARDRLALSVAQGRKGPACQWLDELRDASGQPAMVAVSDDAVDVGGVRHACRTRVVDAWPRARQPVLDTQRFWFPTRGPQPHAKAAHRPSGAVAVDARVGEVLQIGRRHTLTTDYSLRGLLGDAFHRFVASDDPELSAAVRRVAAQRQLHALGLTEAPELFVESADALWNALSRRWPSASWMREWPVLRLEHGQRTVGEVDLLGELAASMVLIDHKVFAGDTAGRDAAVQRYSGQMAAYSSLLEGGFGKPVEGAWLHFPMRGELVEVLAGRDDVAEH